MGVVGLGVVISEIFHSYVYCCCCLLLLLLLLYRCCYIVVIIIGIVVISLWIGPAKRSRTGCEYIPNQHCFEQTLFRARDCNR